MPRSKPTPPPSGPTPKPRRVSRAEREATRQTWLRRGMAVALGLLVAVLAAGALNEYLLTPNATLARVGTTPISRQDYWKVRAVDLFEQANQYQQFASFVGPDQQGQYVQMAQAALAQIPLVWGSTTTAPDTLNQMIDDQVVLQHAKDLGVDVTLADAETYLLGRFAPPGSPLVTPPPTPTLTAARAAMATGTAAARFGTPTAAPALATPLGPGATPVAGTPPPAATPGPAEVRATAEAGLQEFDDGFLKQARVSRADYLRLVALPAVARQKVRQQIDAGVGQSADQVEASHILVATKDLADQVRQRVTAGGEDFAAVARDTSIDAATAGNGGDLGWFARDEVPKPLADAAFALKPGEVSQPVETDFGWHVVKVVATQADRPLTDAQISRIAQARFDAWMEEQRAKTATSSSLGPTPTVAPGPFAPPVDAPPAPTPTPAPEAAPATPQAGATPVAPPQAATPSG